MTPITASASSIVQATGLAAQFKSIVPSDLFIALGIGFLVGIDKAKFRTQVLPGDTLTLEAKITRRGSLMCVAEVVASKPGEDGKMAVCAQATQKYILDGE